MKNEDRRNQTRGRLIAAARRLFREHGFAGTSTEAILAEAGVARGALYHHYRDKTALFEAVCLAMAQEAAAEIEVSLSGLSDPYEQLAAGSRAWIAFMRRPEARRLLIVEAPGVLGWQRWHEFDRDLSFAALHAGVVAALDAGAIRFEAGADALAHLLNGMMNAIALAPGDADALTDGYIEMLERLRVDQGRG